MKRIFILFIGLFAFISCDEDTFDLSLLENPNELNESSSDPNFLLNQIIFSAATTSATLGAITESTVRLSHQFGAYTGAFSSTGIDGALGAWTNAYNVIANTNLLKNIAEADGLPNHLGIAQVCQSFTFSDMVDCFGDVVYSQAANVEFPLPSADKGEDVYDAILLLLDEAISNLQGTNSKPLKDPIYGNTDAWIKLANTLKLKMYIHTRLVRDNSSAINAIISSGNYIQSESDDFQFEFSSSIAPTDSRSIYFQQNYLTAASNYQSNYLISKLKDRFSTPDPRLRYYIYRQVAEDPTGIFLPCEDQGFDFCYVGDFYWARDHGDDNGVPPDGAQRATYGVYPAGGAYDSDQGQTAALVQSLNGAGIQPLVMSFQVDMLLAESSLMSGTTGDPLTYLKSGIRKSMEKVFAFAPGNNSVADIDEYIANVEAVYNSATSNDERLNVIMTELFLASYGSPLTIYNSLRRTGMPSDIQDPVVNIGAFPRTLFYPSVEVNANMNLDQKLVTDQVFWDNNPAGFIK